MTLTHQILPVSCLQICNFTGPKTGHKSSVEVSNRRQPCLTLTCRFSGRASGAQLCLYCMSSLLISALMSSDNKERCCTLPMWSGSHSCGYTELTNVHVDGFHHRQRKTNLKRIYVHTHFGWLTLSFSVAFVQLYLSTLLTILHEIVVLTKA